MSIYTLIIVNQNKTFEASYEITILDLNVGTLLPSFAIHVPRLKKLCFPVTSMKTAHIFVNNDICLQNNVTLYNVSENVR